MVSSAYLRLLIFLPEILIPVYDSFILAVHVTYAACKLNKQGDYIQPWRTPFPIWNQSSSKCCLLMHTQVSQETGKVVWYSHLFKNFPQFVVIHTGRGFSIVNEAEVFLEFPCFLYDPVNVGSLFSGSSAFSKPSLYIWNFSVHTLLNDFRHNDTSMWKECNCTVVWTFSGIALLWDWNENWPFPFLWPLLSFPILLTYWVQHFNSIIF